MYSETRCLVFGEFREGLGTSEMSLEKIVLKERVIRETGD